MNIFCFLMFGLGNWELLVTTCDKFVGVAFLRDIRVLCFGGFELSFWGLVRFVMM